MNFNLSLGRNSFHPGWLLLLLPPLFGLMDPKSPNGSPVGWPLLLLLLRLLPLLLLVVPLAGWFRRTSSPLALRLSKEFRAQLPGALLAIAAPSLVLLVPDQSGDRFFIMPYAVGCLLLGAAAFGAEFEQRTIGPLLVEPLPRSVLYREKLLVLGTLLGLSLFQTLLGLVGTTQPSNGSHVEWWLVLGWPVFAFCSGPLYSLLTRSTLAGLIFVFGVPLSLCTAGTLVLELLRRMAGPELTEDNLNGLLFAITPVYLLVTTWFGWVTFRGLTVPEGGGGSNPSGFHPLSLPTDALLSRLMPAGGTGRLVRKELRLHVVPWLVAGLMVGLWLLWLAARALVTDEDLKRGLEDSLGPSVLASFLGLLTLLTAGAACVAEERQLGTLEWQITQPTAVNRQWIIKMGVAGFLALSLGFLLPLVLLRVAFGLEVMGGLTEPRDATALAAFGIAAFGLLVISIYASSLCRNTMKAVVVAIGLGGGLAGLLAILVNFMGAMLNDAEAGMQLAFEQGDLTPPAWAPSQELLAQVAVAGVSVASGFLVVALLWFAGRNFRCAFVSGSTIFRQLGAVVAGILLLTTLLGTGFGQLMLLKQRAVLVASEAENRERGRDFLRDWFRNAGTATPELTERFRLSPGASPEALADAIVRQAAHGELNPIIDSVRRSSVPGGQFALDPALMRRYGLWPSRRTTNGVSPKP